MKSRIAVVWGKNTRMILITILFTIAIGVTFGLIKNTVFASTSDSHSKRITSIRIEKGDTLWEIASHFKSKEYTTTKQYIEEIKRCNGIKTDTIHEGQYLIVPYYVK